MSEKQLLKVSADDAGQRLDLFLSRQLEQVSRSAAQRWIRSGCVTVSGARRKANYPLRAGEEVLVEPPPPEPADLTAEKIPLDIVHENEWFLVVNQPGGMVVHPGAGNRTGTLANALLYYLSEASRPETARPGIVHRLDKGTSGLLIVAKTDHAHDLISRQFKLRQVEKRYLVLVHGRLPSPQGTVSLSIGRDPWVRTKISGRGRRTREAVTRYEVIRHLKGFTYVRAYPQTGRTHQIRVHFQHLGHPVVGDETYGGGAARLPAGSPEQARIRKLQRIFLHAEFLRFEHPGTGEEVSFEAPLPPELADLLESLE